MLGPEANHYITVSQRRATSRGAQGHMGDLMPLLGDGLLTIDGDFHRRAARSCCPPSTASASRPPTRSWATRRRQALDRVSAGDAVRPLRWTRELALRIAMRALFGLDPDRARAGGLDAAHEFEEALGFWARDYLRRSCAGPGRRGGGCSARARASTRSSSARSTAAARARRARRGHPQPAARGHRRGRARRSPSATSATRS